MCLAFGVESLDDVAAKLSEILELQPPGGPRREGARAEDAEVDRRLAAEGRQAGRLPGDRSPGRRRRSRPAAGADVLARRRRAVHHAARRDHGAIRGPAAAQCRDVPHAGARPALDGDALADPQGRPRRLPLHRGSHGGRRRARARPGHRVLRERTAAEAHRRADGRRLPARRAGRARQGSHGRPRGAGRCRDRARGLHRQGRPRDRGPVRRPHRLLHAGRAVPGLQRHRDHDAARRDLSVDRRRQAAAGGCVARARRPSGSSCRP